MASSVVDVGLRNTVAEDDVALDTLLRLGPVQPKGITFKTTTILVGDRLKSLKFQDSWYEGRPWLEYSREDDAACCFYCRLFKPKVNGECHILAISIIQYLRLRCFSLILRFLFVLKTASVVSVLAFTCLSIMCFNLCISVSD